MAGSSRHIGWRGLPVALAVLMAASCDVPSFAFDLAPSAQARGRSKRAKKVSLASFAKHVPQDAAILVSLDLAGFLDVPSEMLKMPKARAAALTRDLAAVCKRFVGSDPTAATALLVVGFVDSQDALVFAAGPFGKARLRGEIERIDGLRVVQATSGLYVAKTGAFLVAGTKGAMARLAAVHERKAGSLARSAALKVHEAVRRRAGPGGLVASLADQAALAKLMKHSPLKGLRVRALGLSVGGPSSEIVVAVDGDDQARQALGHMVEQGLGALRLQARTLGQIGATSEDFAEALGSVLGSHALGHFAESVAVSTRGDILRVAAPFPVHSEATTMPILAILSSVAIPAFIKYQRRVKTTEATDELDRIYKGAATYFVTPHHDAEGNLLACQFPASQGITPSPTCCGVASSRGPDTDGDGRCDFNPDAWATPTWDALKFHMPDPHYFIYSFASSGTGEGATFTASAYGDLDCDGIMSTFQRIGYGAPDLPADACQLRGTADFYVDRETE